MTRHFTPEEFVDALEQPLSSERASHLSVCAACHAELNEMRMLMSDVVIARDVPEPSPLFWNHLSARVREAVDAEPIPAAWWRVSWRPLVAIVGGLAMVIVALVLRTSPHETAAPSGVTQAQLRDAADLQEGDAVWALINEMAPSMRVEEAREAGFVPGRAVTDAAIESLTPKQRQELARLLRAEMGSTE